MPYPEGISYTHPSSPLYEAPAAAPDYWADEFRKVAGPLEMLGLYLGAMLDQDWEQVGQRETERAQEQLAALTPGLDLIRAQMLATPGEAGAYARDLFKLLDEMRPISPEVTLDELSAMMRDIRYQTQPWFTQRVTAAYRKLVGSAAA